MMLSLRRSTLSGLLLSLVACGGGFNPDRAALDEIPDEQNVGGQKFIPLTPSENLSFGDGSISGNGTIKFAEALDGVDSDYNFQLRFTLEDEGELIFHSHADADLERAFRVHFKQDGGVLEVSASGADGTDDWSEFFEGLNARQTLTIAIDVHNGEPSIHALVWNDAVEPAVELLDTALDTGGGPGNGLGQNWGLKLRNAIVHSIRKGDPRYVHP